MSEITPDDLRLLMSGIGDKYYTASRNIESWVTLRIPLECKPVLDDALKLAYNLVRCKNCKFWNDEGHGIGECLKPKREYTTKNFYCDDGDRGRGE